MRSVSEKPERNSCSLRIFFCKHWKHPVAKSVFNVCIQVAFAALSEEITGLIFNPFHYRQNSALNDRHLECRPQSLVARKNPLPLPGVLAWGLTEQTVCIPPRKVCTSLVFNMFTKLPVSGGLILCSKFLFSRPVSTIMYAQIKLFSKCKVQLLYLMSSFILAMISVY